MSDPGEADAHGCDPEKVFEFADASGGPGGLDPEERRETREHILSCRGCRELYDHELALNDYLSSLDLPARCSSLSVSRGVAMALPTRSLGARVLWGLLASALLVAAVLCLKFNGTEPVILLMSTLSVCWGFMAGSAKVVYTILTVASPTIIPLLALGALADLFIAFVVLSRSRSRRAREA